MMVMANEAAMMTMAATAAMMVTIKLKILRRNRKLIGNYEKVYYDSTRGDTIRRVR